MDSDFLPPEGQLPDSDTNLNPYSTAGTVVFTNSVTAVRDWVMVIPKCFILLAFAYPLIALLFVHLAVLMEAGLGMHGAVIGSYKTLLGVTFNVAAILVMGFMLFIPVGFLASIFTGWALGRTKQIFLFPAIYIGMCAGAFVLVLLDPIGVFEYFFD